jgi:hypothetical protein
VTLYKATLYERPTFGDRCPVIFEGKEVSSEIVAETASKARYKFYTELHDGSPDVQLQDIRVRSLAKDPARSINAGWESRLELVNAVIRVIGSHGRRFLSENSDRREPKEDPFFAHFQLDKRNELWYVDRYTRKPILIRLRDWPGFSDGGTLRSLVTHLGGFITGGAEIDNRLFGPWPQWICRGDLWGYGDDMSKVRDGIAELLQKRAA